MRASEKKRRSFMTPAKWLWIVAAAVLTFLIWLGLYYRDIQIPHWASESDAKARIVATGEVAAVDALYKHIWDDTTWIGLGLDSNGEASYVFLKSDESTVKVSADDVLTEEEMTSKFRESRPNSNLIRLQPAIFNGSPAWEAYYAGTADGVKYHYYDFYSFDKDGRLLDTYLLPQ